jgi:rhomboid protease GluP
MGSKRMMNDAVATQPLEELFRPSLKSPWIRIGIGVGALSVMVVVFALLTTAVWSARAWAMMSVLLIVSGALGYAIRRQIKIDKCPVLLTTKGIESLSFCGAKKNYRWQDIANAWIVPVGNGHALHLELLPGVPTTAGTWLSRRSQPFIALSTFSATERDLIFDAVIQHLRQTHPGEIVVNHSPQEREPLEQVIARAPRPWVTYALILINVVLSLFMVYQGADALRPSDEWLLRWGGHAASEVQRGQWWRVMTATFVHNGLVHLAITMLGLWSIGRVAERIYGYRPFLMIYLGAAIAGSAFALHFSAQKMVFVGGASCAVFGLAGALMVAVYQNREILPKLLGKPELAGMGIFALYALVQGFRPGGIDHGAHVGALVTGAILAALLPERFDMRQYEKTIQVRSATGIAGALVLSVVVALLAPSAATDVSRPFTGPAAFDKGVKSFAQASRLMQEMQEQVKAGNMTDSEFDAKTRSVLAPAFRQTLVHYDQAWFAPTDPRHELLLASRHLTELMVELLAMESVVSEANSIIVPVDPIRATLLNADIRAAAEHKQEIEDRLNAAPPAINK